MRFVIDTATIKRDVQHFLQCFLIDTETKLNIKNKGYYIQIQSSEFDKNGCPRCNSRLVRFVKKSPNGIATGHINECQTCGQWFDIVMDYDKW